MDCSECGKKLVAIGLSRKNGKSHPDWDSRKMHKKCYAKYRERRRFFDSMEEKFDNVKEN